MSKNEKLEKDFRNLNLVIERMAEEEIKKIREEAIIIKEEATRIGEDIESSMGQIKEKATGKKVNR